jgi:hypothetical protein
MLAMNGAVVTYKCSGRSIPRIVPRLMDKWAPSSYAHAILCLFETKPICTWLQATSLAPSLPIHPSLSTRPWLLQLTWIEEKTRVKVSGAGSTCIKHRLGNLYTHIYIYIYIHLYLYYFNSAYAAIYPAFVHTVFISYSTSHCQSSTAEYCNRSYPNQQHQQL